MVVIAYVLKSLDFFFVIDNADGYKPFTISEVHF